MKIIILLLSITQVYLIYYSVELFERAKMGTGFTSIGPDIIVYYYILSLLGVLVGAWKTFHKKSGGFVSGLCLILSLIGLVSFAYLQASGIVGYYQKPE